MRLRLLAVLVGLLACFVGQPAGGQPAGQLPGQSAGQPAAGPAVPPVPGPPVRAFNPPASPFGAGHRGVDLAAGPGEVVRAAMDGLVAFSGEVAGRGWVTLRHGGDLETTYGVLEPRLVVAGQRVRAGDPLGVLAADADHLDWGARLVGAYIDPLSLLGRWRVHLVDVG
ncbi:MAG TPA: M23 family metallopeptidase, partial [Egibacteraceae bacterium]|nr:M23 family metallopeptidase [Egibacteraceae bacterium]